MQGLAPLHRAIYLRLAPHFGSGLFSSGCASCYTCSVAPLSFAQEVDRLHRAGWWIDVRPSS